MSSKHTNHSNSDIHYHSLSRVFLSLALLSFIVTACTSAATSVAPPPEQTTTASVLSVTPSVAAATAVPTPTQTPEPLAVRVNGEGILLVEYDVEFRQLQEAQQTLGKTMSAEEQRQQVLENMISILLLAQGAYEAGFVLDETTVQSEIDRMAAEMGGPQAFTDWITQQGYTDFIFRSNLIRQLAAAWQRDQIVAQVPTTAEQVQARQILTTDADIANRALEQVKVPGVNFAAQASLYDSETGGDLGWFPRGYLIQPEVEEAAFQLQPGEISPVVKSSIGYHIIQVISREPERVLSPDARRVLQHKALETWVAERRAAGQIEILAP